MKLIILFFSLSLFLPTLHAFKIYRCASSLNETNLCYKMDMDMSDVIYYVGGCAEDEYCSEDSEVGYCTKLPVKREDGESCSANSDCRSSLCEEGTCTRRKDGESCERHANCGNGSFCYDEEQICKALYKEGDLCESDYECGFDLVCSYRHCEKMFSFESGEASDNSLACKTGFSTEIDRPEGYDYYCTEKKLNTPTCKRIYDKTCEY